MAKHSYGNSTIGAGQFGGKSLTVKLNGRGDSTKGAGQFGKGKKKSKHKK